jgi:hypothetical protein
MPAHMTLKATAFLLTALVGGCAVIKGVSYTNLYADLLASGTFAVRLLEGNPVIAPKLSA